MGSTFGILCFSINFDIFQTTAYVYKNMFLMSVCTVRSVHQ